MSTVSPNIATVIIAAYNEASLIRSTLSALIHNDNHYQVLVICNGCNDNTEDIIKREFNNVLCYSIPQASKSLAIRYAESLNPGFPRLYLDADIQLNAVDAIALIQYAKARSDPALVVPASYIDKQKCHRLVKRFYRAWYQTSFVQELGFGAGAYLLNKSARDRFDIWPELIADDGFVRSQFNTQEIHVLAKYKTYVKAPKDIFSLINVKTRSKLGNIELNNYLDRSGTSRSQKLPIKRPQTLTKSNKLDKLVYLVVNLIALTLAKWQSFTGFKSWSRDNSNR